MLPDADMPVDELGNRADIIADAGSSTISRMNIGRLYEHYMGAFSRDNQRRLIDHFQTKYGADYIFKLTHEDVEYSMNYLREMFTPINTEMLTFLDRINEEEKRAHLLECLTEAIYIYYPTDNENNIVDVIKNIEKSPYKPHLGKVTYRDELGKLVTTKSDVRIGKMDIIVLDRIANGYAATSSARVNSFNFPIKSAQADRFKYPHSLTPTTTLSETEVRILSSFAEPALIAELVDLALNPISHKFLIRNILEKEEAFSTDYDIDREVDGYGNTKSLALLKHVFYAAGFTFEHSEQD